VVIVLGIFYTTDPPVRKSRAVLADKERKAIDFTPGIAYMRKRGLTFRQGVR
jgi:hypothetical protein